MKFNSIVYSFCYLTQFNLLMVNLDIMLKPPNMRIWDVFYWLQSLPCKILAFNWNGKKGIFIGYQSLSCKYSNSIGIYYAWNPTGCIFICYGSNGMCKSLPLGCTWCDPYDILHLCCTWCNPTDIPDPTAQGVTCKSVDWK